MKTFNLEIASPGGKQFEGEVVQISLRSIVGEIAILAGHIPYMTAVGQGICRILLPDGERRRARVNGGFLSVTSETTRLLSSDFTWLEGGAEE